MSGWVCDMCARRLAPDLMEEGGYFGRIRTYACLCERDDTFGRARMPDQLWGVGMGADDLGTRTAGRDGQAGVVARRYCATYGACMGDGFRFRCTCRHALVDSRIRASPCVEESSPALSYAQSSKIRKNNDDFPPSGTKTIGRKTEALDLDLPETYRTREF